jgi:hypothetical protein
MGNLRDPVEGRRTTAAVADHSGGESSRGGMVMSGVVRSPPRGQGDRSTPTVDAARSLAATSWTPQRGRQQPFDSAGLNGSNGWFSAGWLPGQDVLKPTLDSIKLETLSPEGDFNRLDELDYTSKDGQTKMLVTTRPLVGD